MEKNRFFNTKKRTIISLIVISFVLAGVFFVSAYTTGKNVVDDVTLQ